MTRSITNKKTRSEYSSREHLYLATSALGILPPAPGISKAPTSASKNNQGCGSPFNFSGSGPSCFLKYGFGSRSSCLLIRIRIQPKITFITNFFAFLLLLFFNFFFLPGSESTAPQIIYLTWPNSLFMYSISYLDLLVSDGPAGESRWPHHGKVQPAVIIQPNLEKYQSC